MSKPKLTALEKSIMIKMSLGDKIITRSHGFDPRLKKTMFKVHGLVLKSLIKKGLIEKCDTIYTDFDTFTYYKLKSVKKEKQKPYRCVRINGKVVILKDAPKRER